MKILFHWSDRIKISDSDKITNQDEMEIMLEHFSPCRKLKEKEIHVFYDHFDELDVNIAGEILCGPNKIATFTCGFRGIKLSEITKWGIGTLFKL